MLLEEGRQLAQFSRWGLSDRDGNRCIERETLFELSKIGKPSPSGLAKFTRMGVKEGIEIVTSS